VTEELTVSIIRVTEELTVSIIRVTEELTVSIIRVTEELTISIIRVTEAVSSSETLINIYQTTWCYIPEDSQLQRTFCMLDTCIGKVPSNL
jgi:hypothetical protein